MRPSQCLLALRTAPDPDPVRSFNVPLHPRTHSAVVLLFPPGGRRGPVALSLKAPSFALDPVEFILSQTELDRRHPQPRFWMVALADPRPFYQPPYVFRFEDIDDGSSKEPSPAAPHPTAPSVSQDRLAKARTKSKTAIVGAAKKGRKVFSLSSSAFGGKSRASRGLVLRSTWTTAKAERRQVSEPVSRSKPKPVFRPTPAAYSEIVQVVLTKFSPHAVRHPRRVIFAAYAWRMLPTAADRDVLQMHLVDRLVEAQALAVREASGTDKLIDASLLKRAVNAYLGELIQWLREQLNSARDISQEDRIRRAIRRCGSRDIQVLEITFDRVSRFCLIEMVNAKQVIHLMMTSEELEAWRVGRYHCCDAFAPSRRR